jgi:hypothetical protein
VAEFRAGAVVLQDARMRSEGLPPELGVAVVEGDSDRRVMRGLCVTPKQIVVSTNKSLSLDAYQQMNTKDRQRIVFIVDCDGDIPPQTRGPNLIITRRLDLEADLLDLGVLEDVVAELVRSATEDTIPEIAKELLKQAVRVAAPVGRMRKAARMSGISMKAIEPWNIDFESFDGEQIDHDQAFNEVSRRAALTRHQEKRIQGALGSIPSGFAVCNGHDLIAAVEYALSAKYGVSKKMARGLDAMVRLAFGPTHAASWVVVQRIRRWEQATGRQILKI